MCGIAGIIGLNSLPAGAAEALKLMEHAIKHRGPDGSGTHVHQCGGFLNVRLAIVDREGGAQPIYNESGDVGIVYNGEVYNFPKLRKELEACGAQFKTSTDTEVILQLYLAHGANGFQKLNGMFAFCIWDDRSGEIYIVRDQIGIKPLYVYRDSEKLLFASEVKALQAVPGLDLALDDRGIYDYFTFRYTQAPFTCFKNISRLDAGTYLKIYSDRVVRHTYWDVEYKNPSPSTHGYSVEQSKKLVREKLLAAVESQLMGEVPIGVLLSGGVDSSVIAWCIHNLGANLTTYNIGFPDVNEFEYSREIAKAFNLKHVEVCTSPEELLNDFDAIVRAIDEPIADPACFPLYQLCKELKKSVTVVLSGEGGDELFGGYPQYVRVMQREGIAPELQFNEFLDASYYFRTGIERFFHNKHIPPHVLRWRKYFVEQDGINRMLAYDMRTWMPDNLMMKADKILMAHSLEGRFPFLDLDLFNFAAQLPESFKVNADQVTKWILKESFSDVLPELIVKRPKMGFSVPVDGMLTALKERALETPNSLKTHPLSDILDLNSVQNLFEDHYSGKSSQPLQVWTIFILLSWFRIHYKNANLV